jgi:hypothetical protein
MGAPDALWLSQTTPQARRNQPYGLPGDFTELMGSLKAPASR